MPFVGFSDHSPEVETRRPLTRGHDDEFVVGHGGAHVGLERGDVAGDHGQLAAGDVVQRGPRVGTQDHLQTDDISNNRITCKQMTSVTAGSPANRRHQ